MTDRKEVKIVDADRSVTEITRDLIKETASLFQK